MPPEWGWSRQNVASMTGSRDDRQPFEVSVCAETPVGAFAELPKAARASKRRRSASTGALSGRQVKEDQAARAYLEALERLLTG